MSTKSALCPGCGAEIVFQNSATLFVVCPFCSAGSFSRDLRLESIGHVAEVAPIESPIALRATGKIDGQRFTVVGQLQLQQDSADAAPWNEWCILLEDGTSAWLAEAQGQVLFTRALEQSVPTTWAEIVAGNPIDLGPHGRWIVVERGIGRVTAARGELSAALPPGSVVRYADLSGPKGGFGTLDYGSGERCDTVYLGRRLDLANLALDTLGAEARQVRKVGAKRIDCPACSGAIDVRDPGNSVRVVCPYCSAVLDPTSEKARVLEIAPKMLALPQIPIGSKGKLSDGDYEVLAYLERSVTADGERYPWDEYLLRRADGAYRWLVCSQRHWSFVEPLNLADVQRSGSRARYRGESFRHFSGGKARVDHVLGEVYWEVKVGEAVQVDDFVAPPRMISFETTRDEKIVSLGSYVTADEVKRAFGLPKDLLRPDTAGVLEPNPHKAATGAWWKLSFVLIAVVLVLDAAFHVVRNEKIVHSASYPVAPPSAGPDRGRIVSDEFAITGWRSNAEIDITAPGLDQGRFSVEGALVETATGAVHDFGLRATRQVDVQAGNPMGVAHVRLGGLPAGAYRLRLDPHAETPEPAATFTAVVKSPIASDGLPLVIAFLLLLPPIVVAILGLTFEARRWAQSDHAG